MIRYECDCRWRSRVDITQEHTPFIGGYLHSGEPMYVAKFNYARDVLPAYSVPTSTTCWSSYGRVQCEGKTYDLLLESKDDEFVWEKAADGNIVPGSVRGGETERGEVLYIGRVTYRNGTIIGKIHRSHGGCYYGINGTEMISTVYEVLVCNYIMHGKQVEVDEDSESYDDY